MLTSESSVDKDPEISPGSITSNAHLPPPRPPKPSAIAPWETARPADYHDYRKGGPAAVKPDINVPQLSQHPPTATSPGGPWSPGSPSSITAGNSYNSFFDDSLDELGQLSPGFRPGTGHTDELGHPGDARRPSIASATTVSSSGSKSSMGRGFHKKLQGFFGDEFPLDRQNSDTSLPPNSIHSFDRDSSSRLRNRNSSVNNFAPGLSGSRPASPPSSRPRTPLPSSEVTPWEYQDNKVRERPEFSQLCPYWCLYFAVCLLASGGFLKPRAYLGGFSVFKARFGMSLGGVFQIVIL